MENIAKSTSYGCYLDCDFETAKYPDDKTHIVGLLAEYVYDLEQRILHYDERYIKLWNEIETLRECVSKEFDQEQQIANLEAKLAESEKDVANKEKRIVELKQQLHDMPKKIVEEIRDCLLDFSNGWWRYFMTDGCEYMLSSDLQGCLDEIIDTILKKYGEEDESK